MDGKITSGKGQLLDFINKYCFVGRVFDIKKATLNGEFLSLLNDYFFKNIYPKFKTTNLLLGASEGGSYVIPSLTLAAYNKGLKKIHSCIVRNNPKGYGVSSVFINKAKGKHRKCLIVHDILDEHSFNEFSEVCNVVKDIYKIQAVIIIVDNYEYWSERLREFLNTKIITIINYSDLEKCLTLR